MPISHLLFFLGFPSLGVQLNLLGFLGFAEFLSSNKRKAPPSLLNLCLGVVGCNLEDIVDDLAEIALAFPADIKVQLLYNITGVFGFVIFGTVLSFDF